MWEKQRDGRNDMRQKRRNLTSLRNTEADACDGERHAVKLPAGSGLQFLSLPPRHQPREAALLPLLRGPEPCPELAMALLEHSRTTLPLALKESKHLN